MEGTQCLKKTNQQCFKKKNLHEKNSWNGNVYIGIVCLRKKKKYMKENQYCNNTNSTTAMITTAATNNN